MPARHPGPADAGRRACKLALLLAGAMVAALALGQPLVADEAVQPPLALPSESAANDELQASAHVLVDEKGRLGLEEVIRRFGSGEGEAVVTHRIMPMAGGSAVWYQLQFPQLQTAMPMILGLPHPGLDTADFYRPALQGDGSYRWAVQRSGDQRPVAEWPVANLYPAFNLTLGPGEMLTGYLRVTNIYPVSLNWKLWEASRFHDHMKNGYLLLGIYIGLVFLMVVVSCVQAVSWQEPIHFLYAGYVTVVALTQLCLTGLGGEYFWPRLAWWNDRSLSTLALSSSALLHLFFRRLLADRALPLVSMWLLLMALSGGALVIGSLAPDRTPVMPLVAPYYVLGLLTYLGVAGWYAWRRPRVGLWILAGVACLAAGAIFPILRLFGLLPATLATQYGAQAGAALQIPLLLVGLYFGSREKRASLVRMGAMPTVDPLTGVASHRVLMRRIGRLLERQKRDRDEGAVIRVRIGNLPAIRREHGLDVAETAVVQASALLTGMGREGDTVARHREGDFVLMLQGHLTRAGLVELGQRLIARGLAECPSLPPGTVLHLRLAVADSPAPELDAEMLLQRLGKVLLDSGKRSGTGLWFVARSATDGTTSGV